MGNANDQVFHELWTWAVGKPGYDKEQWKELEEIVNKAVYGPRNAAERGEKVDVGDGRVTKIVEPGSVHIDTITGWNVIGRYQEKHCEHAKQTVPDPKAHYSQETMELVVPMEVTKTFFVLEQTDKQYIKEQDDLLGYIRNEKEGLEKELEELKAKNKTLADRWDDASGTVSKYVRDIAKIREAIGSERIAQILDDK